MAIYPFECLKCDNEFEIARPMSEYQEPGICPTCGNVGKVLDYFLRVLSLTSPGFPSA